MSKIRKNFAAFKCTIPPDDTKRLEALFALLMHIDKREKNRAHNNKRAYSSKTKQNNLNHAKTARSFAGPLFLWYGIYNFISHVFSKRCSYDRYYYYNLISQRLSYQ